MDKVRFGRALGYGARHTAKAIYKAVDAARAPDSTAQPRPAAQVERPQAASVRPSPQVAAKQAKALGRSVWKPLAQFSGVLWLQVTGSIYAVIALAMAQAIWLRRADLHLSAHTAAAQRAYLLSAICLLFAYFAVSSFVRAHRRERR